MGSKVTSRGNAGGIMFMRMKKLTNRSAEKTTNQQALIYLCINCLATFCSLMNIRPPALPRDVTFDPIFRSANFTRIKQIFTIFLSSFRIKNCCKIN